MSGGVAVVELGNWFPCWMCFALRSHFGLGSVPCMSESDPGQPFSLLHGKSFTHTSGICVELAGYSAPGGVSVGIGAFPDGFVHVLKFD